MFEEHPMSDKLTHLLPRLSTVTYHWIHFSYVSLYFRNIEFSRCVLEWLSLWETSNLAVNFRCGVTYPFRKYESLLHHFGTTTATSLRRIWKGCRRNVIKESRHGLFLIRCFEEEKILPYLAVSLRVRCPVITSVMSSVWSADKYDRILQESILPGPFNLTVFNMTSVDWMFVASYTSLPIE